MRYGKVDFGCVKGELLWLKNRVCFALPKIDSPQLFLSLFFGCFNTSFLPFFLFLSFYMIDKHLDAKGSSGGGGDAKGTATSDAKYSHK